VKRPGLVILVAALSIQAFGDDANEAAGPRPFVSVNVLALAAGWESPFSSLIVPLVSNLETGLSVSAGVHLRQGHSLEGRVSIGPANLAYTSFQLHAGYRFLVLDYFDVTETGLYAGAFFRYVRMANRHNDISYSHVMPYAVIGYELSLGRVFIDLRLSQSVASLSWSNQQHTTANMGWSFSLWNSLSPVLPSFSINLGHMMHDLNNNRRRDS